MMSTKIGHRLVASICVAGIAAWGNAAGCADGPCQEACEHAVDVCHIGGDTVEDCVADCEDEPWPENYRECRATTCESEAVCETWGE